MKKEKCPLILKNADITAVFKKGYQGSEGNYRPVSILPIISKPFEKIICKQVAVFMDPLLPKYQCWFRRGFSTQTCLLAMLKKWKFLSVDKRKAFGVLLTDLLTAFDSLSHKLIITKWNPYGFSFPALKLMQIHVTERKQKTKINQAYSFWEEILFDLTKGLYLVGYSLTFF